MLHVDYEDKWYSKRKTTFFRVLPINLYNSSEIAENDDDYLELYNREYLWPAKGDRLFRATDDWEWRINFTDHRISRFLDIWIDYSKSGKILIEECQRDPTIREFMIYPILYCYRHSLELAMKWVIWMYGRPAGVYSGDYRDHDLWKLWTGCKKVILHFRSDGESETLRAVEQIIRDFHDWDKSSIAFRYSDDKNSLIPKLPDLTIDLDNIKNVMQAVANFFTGVDGQLGFY
jgi:hypothetical protein